MRLGMKRRGHSNKSPIFTAGCVLSVASFIFHYVKLVFK